MPLPRFTRLPAERQALILAVARAHFARDGKDGASINQIIAEAGLSKTSAYQYFDGKEDLAAAVLSDVDARMNVVVGPWQRATTAAAFWRALEAASSRLMEHVLAHPDDLASLRALSRGQMTADNLRWFEGMIDNGIALELIRADVDRRLMTVVTVAFFQAVDTWALDALAEGLTPDTSKVWSLLSGLWSISPARKRSQR